MEPLALTNYFYVSRVKGKYLLMWIACSRPITNPNAERE